MQFSAISLADLRLPRSDAMLAASSSQLDLHELGSPAELG
jgi:hypothetical protein